MCLNILHTVKQTKKILDKITSKGLKVYKIVGEHIKNKECVSPYAVIPSNTRIDKTPYKNGVNEANTNFEINYKIRDCGKFTYEAGFHFFKSKEDAKRFLDYMNYFLKENEPNLGYTFKLITCIVKKSWISKIGLQVGIKNNDYDVDKQDVVIVAKKAIFNLGEK